MAKHLLRFIRGEIKELDDSKHILYDNFDSNPEGVIPFEDIAKWVSLISPKTKFEYINIESSLTKMIINPNVNMFKLIGIKQKHLYAVYNNNGTLENYETTYWQKTANNCSLYAGLVLVIRPLLNSMAEMVEILNMLIDEKDTSTCEKLAQISKYYFGRGIEWFWFRFNASNTIINAKCTNANKTLYVYFYDMNPFGLLNVDEDTKEFKKIKGVDFKVYTHCRNTPDKETIPFINWYNIMKRNYDKFAFIGRGYGSLFAITLAQKIKENEPNKNISITSVSYDGHKLINMCESIRDTVLEMKNKPTIHYGETLALCNDVDLVKEWLEIKRKECVEAYGEDLIEINAIEWYKIAKMCNELTLNHSHLKFNKKDIKVSDLLKSIDDAIN